MGNNVNRERAINASALKGVSLDDLMNAMTGVETDVPTSALALAADGSIQLGNFTITARGMLVGEGATLDEWQQVGQVISRLNGALQWVIGDWCLSGERKWGKTVEQIAEAFGYKPNSIHQFTWVCRSVDFSIRIETLDFGHHMLVAALENQKLQREWLEYAARQTPVLSVAKMRTLMRGEAEGDPVERLIDAKAARAIKRALSWDVGTVTDEKARARMLKDIEAARRTLDAVEKKVRGE